jgi:heme-degrading monooxygenase HmoA
MIIELTQFRLNEGIDENAFVEMTKTVEIEFFKKQQGFISMELCRDGDGQWANIIKWDSKENAEMAMSESASNHIYLGWFQVMNQGSIKTIHLNKINE